MRVYKFGGASVKNAEGFFNVASILKDNPEQLLVVVSAMGKTTNSLERIVTLAQAKHSIDDELSQLVAYHEKVVAELFKPDVKFNSQLTRFFSQVEGEAKRIGDPDQIYDQVVSLGEVISTFILSRFLTQQGISNEWVDARTFVSTDSHFREGQIDWDKTRSNTQNLQNILSKKIIITQGFIGYAPGGATTTLGRDGSDYSAAIFASCLNAESVTIWKDVPGVMNADPRRLPAATVFGELPYKEAAEMTYYGASVIHPKTIKPLANKGIPLFVKNFDNVKLEGTKIHECKVDHLPPLIVFKDNQCLISCKVTDYTFIDERHLGAIFQALSDRNVKINVMQSSAISFSFCVDFREGKIADLVKHLGQKFEVYYNTGLTLITIKNYDQKTFNEYRLRPGVVLEQSSRSTLQVLVKS
jgi:aspartate kinase